MDASSLKSSAKLTIIAVVLLIGGFGCASFSVNPAEVSKVEIKYWKQRVTLTKKADLEKLIIPLNKTKKIMGTGCPFEMEIKISGKEKSKSKTIYFATDDCPIFRFGEAYYEIPKEANGKIRTEFRRLGIKLWPFCIPDLKN